MQCIRRYLSPWNGAQIIPSKTPPALFSEPLSVNETESSLRTKLQDLKNKDLACYKELLALLTASMNQDNASYFIDLEGIDIEAMDDDFLDINHMESHLEEAWKINRFPYELLKKLVEEKQSFGSFQTSPTSPSLTEIATSILSSSSPITTTSSSGQLFERITSPFSYMASPIPFYTYKSSKIIPR